MMEMIDRQKFRPEMKKKELMSEYYMRWLFSSSYPHHWEMFELLSTMRAFHYDWFEEFCRVKLEAIEEEYKALGGK